MQEKIGEMVRRVEADFADLRYEVKKVTRASFNKQELLELGSDSTDGYVARVLRNGGFASCTVTRPEDVEEAFRRACDAADLVAQTAAEKVELAPAPVVQDAVRLRLDQDPRGVSLHDKLELTRKYNDVLLGQPGIASTNTAYSEVYRDKHYVSSEGSSISEELITANIGGEAIARRLDGLVQNIRVSIGGADGMGRLHDREDTILERAGLARELLDAEPLKAGKYTVVLNSSMTGVFTHEAFGHFSEADIIEKNPSLREKMSLGAELGSGLVTIVADSTLPGQVGFYRYDDEGVPVRPVTLMDNGVLVGRLHSRRTAAAFGEPVTGHSVAEDHRYAPIVRMGTIFVKPGGSSFEELLATVGDGLYLCDAKGGQTAGENFTFGAQYGYRIENGKMGHMVRDINIMGNLFTTLSNIIAVGDDFELSERGGCGKGQMNIKSAHGGPHVVIRDMVVGGA
ncbi:TldD/PmbA family protein [Candidatus Fermentibacterales bacterium]|nr:TldD/PmbA family protein [Candidatus Fermentibacterales bacterium]